MMFFVFFQDFAQNIQEISVSQLYGSSLGNQVDGLPSARHTEALWGPHGVFGPAPIHAHDHVKLRIEDQNDSTVPESFVQVQVCIVALLLG